MIITEHTGYPNPCRFPNEFPGGFFPGARACIIEIEGCTAPDRIGNTAHAMEITLNGKSHPLSGGTTVVGLLAALNLNHGEGGIAVCINGEVIRRTDWTQIEVQAADEVEIVQATQGG